MGRLQSGEKQVNKQLKYRSESWKNVLTTGGLGLGLGGMFQDLTTAEQRLGGERSIGSAEI